MSAGVPFHGVSDLKRERIAELAAKDPTLTLLQIRERLGVSDGLVRKILGPEESARRKTKRGQL